MKNEMYEMIFTKMYQAVDWMVSNYNKQDIERNHRNSGSASAFASVLRSMGHNVDLRVYNQDGYDLTNAIIVNGKQYDFFHN